MLAEFERLREALATNDRKLMRDRIGHTFDRVTLRPVAGKPGSYVVAMGQLSADAHANAGALDHDLLDPEILRAEADSGRDYLSTKLQPRGRVLEFAAATRGGAVR